MDLIETGAYENIRAPYLALNPGGTVPLLVHEGHPIYESHFQIRYAAEHAPEGSPKLTPDDPELRKQMELWIDRSSLTHDPLRHGDVSAGNAVPGLTVPLFATMIERIPVWKVLEGLLFHFDKMRPALFLLLKVRGIKRIGGIPPLARALERSRAQMSVHLDALETQLARTGGPWILGDRYTLADVSWLVIFERLAQTDALASFVAPELRPHCLAWWKRVTDIGPPLPVTDRERGLRDRARAAAHRLDRGRARVGIDALARNLDDLFRAEPAPQQVHVALLVLEAALAEHLQHGIAPRGLCKPALGDQAIERRQVLAAEMGRQIGRGEFERVPVASHVEDRD